MSVRKRTWKTAKGVAQTAWIVDYTDREGDRHIRQEAQARRGNPLADCWRGRRGAAPLRRLEGA
jgi:hypothetical protein